MHQKGLEKRRCNSCSTELECALKDLREIVLDGLRHGFFEYQITGEMLNENKRRLIIKAGKSHRFVISPEELN